jgi:plasmid replication initiation protein
MIHTEDKDFQIYRFSISEFIRDFGIRHKDVYKEIRKVTDSLLKKIVTLPMVENGKEKIFKTTLVSSFKYDVDGKGYIESTFRPELKPFLLELKGRFLMYDMRNILKMSVPSIRIYELLKQYQKIGKRLFLLVELKEKLGVADKYSRYYNFKMKVIVPAQKHLAKHSDIRFDFEELKGVWKWIERIRFLIHANGKEEKVTEKTTNIPLWNTEAYSSLINKWISEKVAKKLTKKHEGQYILDSLHYAEKEQARKKNSAFPIQKISWHIVKAIEDGYYRDEISQSKNSATKKAQGKIKFAQQEEKLKILKKQFESEKAEKLKNVKNKLNVSKITELEQEFSDKNTKDNPIYKRIFQAGKWSELYESSFGQFLSGKLLEKWEVDFEEYRKFQVGK